MYIYNFKECVNDRFHAWNFGLMKVVGFNHEHQFSHSQTDARVWADVKSQNTRRFFHVRIKCWPVIDSGTGRRVSAAKRYGRTSSQPDLFTNPILSQVFCAPNNRENSLLFYGVKTVAGSRGCESRVFQAGAVNMDHVKKNQIINCHLSKRARPSFFPKRAVGTFRNFRVHRKLWFQLRFTEELHN